MIKHDNIIYARDISRIGGVEQFCYELAKRYHNYDTALVCKGIDENQLKRFRKLVPVYIHTNEEIECKTIIINYDNTILDYVKKDKCYQVIHGDYTSSLYTQYPKVDNRIDKVLGITKYICETYPVKEVKPELCYNPLKVEDVPKPLVLVSATRLGKAKGGFRLEAIAQELDRRKIPYVWYMFTDDIGSIKGNNIVWMQPTLNIRPWIAYADVVGQTSDTEALCTTINESLSYEVPVITTPLPYLEELGIKDNENCYVLDFDLKNIGSVVDRIVNNRLKGKFKWEMPKDKYDEIFIKGESKYMYKEEMVKATSKYQLEGMIDGELKRIPNAGDIWMTSEDRALMLVEKGYVEICPKIEEEPKEVEIPKETKKSVKKAKK